jgi:hypothetical protein
MATYYVDGSVAGSAGVLNGSGTLGDPWTQNSGVDLLEAARQAIVTAGIGTAGDTVVVLNGGLSLTVPMTYESGWSQTQPFVVRPHAMDGTQRIDFDMGFQTMFSVNIVQQGHNFYFTDFHGFGNVSSGTYVLNGRNWWGLYFCTFDGADSQGGVSTGIVNAGSNSHFVGNRFINDSRSSGLMLSLSNGCCVRGNYFEINYSSSYSVYTYGSEYCNNVHRVTSASHLGFLLPIQGGMFYNNTFYGVNPAGGTNNGGSIYMPSAYEHNMVINNYFENMQRSVFLNGSADQHQISVFAGNYEFNTWDHNDYPDATNTSFMTNNNNNLSRSGLVDPANGDYRPNDLLIAKGFNLENYSLQGVTTGRKTIGAIESDLIPKRIRDIY